MKRWEIYLDIIMELLVILAGALLLILSLIHISEPTRH